MKLTHLAVHNYAGVHSVSLDVTEKALLICGHNGAGKTSIAQAVRHALTGELSRVSLKKELGQLTHHGAKSGEVSVAFADGVEATVVLPNGQAGISGIEWSVPERNRILGALPFCLDPARFAAVSADERRALILAAAGVVITPKAIGAKLQAHGVAQEDIERIVPYTVNGLDAGAKEAAGQAREAKGAWRNVSGEAWGAQKAKGWQAPVPEGKPANVEAARSAVEETGAVLLGAQGALANAKSKAAEAKRAESYLADLREKAGSFARIQEKMNIDQAELAKYQARLAKARETTQLKGGTRCDCPECGGVLYFHDGLLKPWIAPAEDAAVDILSIAELDRAVTLYQNSVANDQRDLAGAETAAQALTAHEAAVGEVPTADDIEALTVALQTAESAHAQAQRNLQADKANHEAHANAKAKTVRAAAEHARVDRWLKIEWLLLPDGIANEFLAEGYGPFLDALASTGATLGWQMPMLTPDMGVLVNGRSYGLLSESEQWRCDALMAAAIADVSGAKIVALDRFDVLDPKGRSDVLYWAGETDAFESALVLGTMKALPARVPPGVQSVWIADGTTDPHQEAA